MQTNFKNLIYTILVAAILFAGVQTIDAWVSPKVAPPGDNVAAPINISANAQSKKGSLGLGGLAVFGSAIFTGQVKIADGTHGPGKILTSDAAGNATWQYPPEPTTQIVTVPDTTCPTGSSEVSDDGETYCGYVKRWTGGVTYCNGSDRLIRCEDAGVGKNHGVSVVAPNGCQAWEGPGNNGGQAARLYCSKGAPAAR